jgi:hypothetical protein
VRILAAADTGHDLTVDSLINVVESIKDFQDLFGGTYTFNATQHQGATRAFLSVVHNGRWMPVQDTALAH